MATTIPEEFRTFVSRNVESGRFQSEEEAVREGLNLLRERELKLDALRVDLQVGIDQLEAGQSTVLNIEDIKQRGRQRLSESEGSR